MAPSANNRTSPIFSAVSSSTRQLYTLLRCIGFASKAQVQITEDGLRFTAEESRVMQGHAFLDKSLFSAFSYNPPPPHADETQTLRAESPTTPSQTFQISLSALLETLQILGFSDLPSRFNPSSHFISGIASRAGPTPAFDTRTLGLTGLCRLGYDVPGSPLAITLEESGVTTTCKLVTYQPELTAEIPIARDRLALKIIMRATWLHDAFAELGATSPSRLTITASPSAPHFALSASGALGSASVEFSQDAQLLETVQVPRRSVNTYKYSLVKAAKAAMALASKVSIRGDEQGVLSMQFMIEVDGGKISFVDFRFVPLLVEEGEEDEGDEEDEEDDGDEEYED
ncbi:MAG: ssDNA endodeoxyribonuclease [Trizodia sp. TS-e1964]|nr:MAG: ssDNA endodeoxyribonuclease [Trizodia sp. TS-e1964]